MLALLVVQGMLVHVGQWFGLWTITALHPVNALALTYASLTLARRSNALWTASAGAESVVRQTFDGRPSAA